MLLSRELDDADTGLAEGGGTQIADHATGLSGKADQGWSRSAPRSSAMVAMSPPNWPRLWCRGSCSKKFSASSMGCGRLLCRHDDGLSCSMQVARQDSCVLCGSKWSLGRFSHRQISPIKSGPRPIVTDQGRIRGRRSIVPPLSAIGRSHLGNPGLTVLPNCPTTWDHLRLRRKTFPTMVHI